MKKMSKKAAIEMSMSTVVVIVLSVTILIFGMIFVKNIMCSGISLTEEIDEKLMAEIADTFGTTDYGVKCMGEDSIVTLGDGGTRRIACMINTDVQADYLLDVIGIETTGKTGATSGEIQDWVLDGTDDWDGTVPPGTKTVPVLVLDIPKKTSTTNMRIKVNEYIDNELQETHTLDILVKHVGQITSSIC
jgi:hypothetical protein